MSVIDQVIPPQAFEVVRDRISRILADEILNQFQISYNADILNVKVWTERFLQFDKTELPAVNVTLAEGSYGGQTAIQSDGTYRYNIDCYFKSKANEDEPGDVRAMIKLQRLLGICRSIIEDPRYIRLGFSTNPGFVMNRHFETIQIQNPHQKEHDATNSVMGRLVLSVKVPEITWQARPVDAADFVSTIKLSETEFGYLWVNDGSGIYDFSVD